MLKELKLTLLKHNLNLPFLFFIKFSFYWLAVYLLSEWVYILWFFLIKLHLKDKSLLMRIQDFFGGIGNIHFTNRDCDYMVRSIDDIIKIISHFDKYPLITQKKADFELFKRIIDKIIKGEHLTPRGLQEIINIRASINLGLTDKTNFPNTIPVTRPLIKKNGQIPHPPNEWLDLFLVRGIS